MKRTSLRNLVFLIIEDLCIYACMVHNILHNARKLLLLLLTAFDQAQLCVNSIFLKHIYQIVKTSFAELLLTQFEMFLDPPI